MQFLLKAAHETRGKKRLKHIIILACRALAVGMLMFALARPLAGFLSGWKSGKIDTIILLLDRSASMESRSDAVGPSKREAILQRIGSAAKELGNTRLILIDSVTLKAQDVPSPDVLAEISTVSASDSSANIPALLTKGVEYISTANTGKTELWLASDLQKNDWATDDGRWEALKVSLADLPNDSGLRIFGLNNQPENNVNIRVTSAHRSGSELVLDILASQSKNDGSVSVPITYSLDGARTTDALTLNEQTLQFQKRFSIMGRKEGGFGWVGLPADDNPRDNVSYFTYSADRPILTYVVAQDLESAGLLNLLAAPPNYGNQKSVLLTPDQASQIKLNEAALLIWQAPLPTEPLAGEIWKFLSRGGRAVFFPPLEPNDTKFLEMSWSESELAEKDKVFTVTDWERDDGPLRDGVSNTEVPVKSLKAIQRTNIGGTATPLAFWSDSKPAVTRKVIDAGEAIFIGSLPNYSWSNLGDGAVIVPVVQRMIEEGAKELAGNVEIEAGSKEAQPLAGEFRNRVDDYATDGSNAPDQAGIYRNDSETFAINRPLGEDDPEIITREDMDGLLGSNNFRFFGEQSARKTNLVSEVWRAFLAAMLVFLVTEAFLCLTPKNSEKPILKKPKQGANFKPSAAHK